MATYVPGYKRYEREFEPFTPDFKFLDSVLSVRQDRYNTNYKQMNDLYGKIVYADLSREDTKEIRDQYVNKLIPKIEQVSGMDLSIQQNVDAAKSLFTPFYDDDLIVRDLVNTSAYKSAMRTADTYKNSDVDEIRKKYWPTGVEALSYQMEDFLNADRDSALKMAPPTYVPNADLYNVAQEYLKEQGYQMKWVTGTQSGSKFIITGENGERLIPTAYSDLQRALSNDPRIADAYRTDAYVQSRRFAQKGVDAGKYSSIQEGREAWARNTIEELRTRAAESNPLIRKQYEDALASKESWEKYASSKGVVLSEKEVESLELANTEYEEALLSLQNNNEQLERLDAADGNTDYINLVSSLLMSYNLSSDLYAAAKNYSVTHGGVTSVKENPYTKMAIQHKYNKALEDYKLKIQSEQSNKVLDYMRSLGVEPASLTSAKVDQLAVTDPLKRWNQTKNTARANLAQQKLNLILEMNKLEQGSNYRNVLEITDSNGNIVKGTPEQVQRALMEAGDYAAIDKAYQPYSLKYNDIIASMAEDSKHPDKLRDERFLPVAQTMTRLRRQQAQIVAEEKASAEVLSRTFELLKAESNTEHGKAINTLLKNGAPSPISSNGQFLTEDQYIQKFQEALQKGLVKDPDGKAYPKTMSMQPGKQYSDQEISKMNESVTRMGGWLIFSNDPESAFHPANMSDQGQGAGRRLAKEAYSKYRGAFNLALSGALEEPGGADIYPNYSPEAFYRGVDPDDMTTSNLYIDRTYSANWNAATMVDDPEVSSIYGDFVRQWRLTPDQMKITIPGKATSKTAGDVTALNDATAKVVIEDLILKSMGVLTDAADGKIGQSNQDFGFQINYEPTRVIDGKEYGAYSIKVPTSFLKEYQGTGDMKSGSGKIAPEDMDSYQTVSFLVPQDQDRSARRSGAYNPSWVQTEINLSEDNMFEFNDYSKFAGDIKIYEENGMYYGSYTQAYKDETGAYAYRQIPYSPILDNQTNEPISKNNIDQWVANQILILELLHSQNQE